MPFTSEGLLHAGHVEDQKMVRGMNQDREYRAERYRWGKGGREARQVQVMRNIKTKDTEIPAPYVSAARVQYPNRPVPKTN